MRFLVFILFCSFLVAQNPFLYQISTRAWLFELSEKYARPITKLKDIPIAEFQALKNQGVEVIWMMGLWKLGFYGLARSTDIELRNYYGRECPDYEFDDIIGSSFAVVDYVCNPDIGSDTDIKNLKKLLNSMGIGLMVDFVPNHAAVDSPLVKSKPELFIQVVKGTPKPYDPKKYIPNGIAYGKDPYFDPWSDTVQWNVWNPETKNLLTEYLLKVASMSDYIRVDMAMLLLNSVFEKTWNAELKSHGWTKPSVDFWESVIPAVKKHFPNVKFLAEVYWEMEGELIRQGFDYVYDKGLYDKLHSGNLNAIRQHIQTLPFLSKSAKFVENHDEARAVKHFGVERSIAAALISYTLPGMRFHHHGQWIGKQYKLVVQLRRTSSEPVNTKVKQFYEKLLPIITHPVFNSTWYWADTGAQALLAWRWTDGQHKRLVVINYSNEEGVPGTIKVPDAQPRGGGDNVVLKDLLTGNEFTRNAKELRENGLHVVVSRWFAHMFEY